MTKKTKQTKTQTDRVAVWCANAAYYEKAIVSIRSMLMNNPTVQTILYAEHDKVDGLDERVRVINIKKQAELLDKDGPNYGCRWTYMSLVPLLMPKLLPEYDKILQMDADTITDADISELFDIDLGENYFAGAIEPWKTRGTPYINAGVVLWNLAKIREYGADEKMLREINSTHYDFPDQDVINHNFGWRIMPISPIYNATLWTDLPDDFKIRHFAAEQGYESGELWMKYKEGCKCL